MIRLPGHAPFDGKERKALESLLGGLSGEQQQWLGGYLASAGEAGRGAGGEGILVLYGTESGNCEQLAEETVKEAKRRGFKARVGNMAEMTPDDLVEAGNLLVIVSTWGEGDPPETAEDFYKAIMNGGPRLESLRFSVCALGDTSYDQYCEIGKQFDRRLEELGAERIASRVDCDVDFEEPYAQWLDQALGALGARAGEAASGASRPAAEAVPAGAFGKKNPFPSEILDKVVLNGTGSAKETWHLELSLERSGLVYEPGDSLAVVPRNAPDVVEAMIDAASLDGTVVVETKSGDSKPLRDALEWNYDITDLSRKVAKGWQERSQSDDLAKLLDDSDKAPFKAYCEGRQIVDLLADYPASGLSGQELISLLRALPPRLYSIASSPRAHPGEVHLTVAAVRYETHGRSRKGVASTFLADIVAKGDPIGVFVTPNKRFRLPENDEAPIIMVGPGTGIAPFRAFVEERAERGAKGASWLIFGDQRYTYDFLYQLEWQDHLKSGALSRLDVAFSRDQPEKVYVQDRMRERAADLYAWLEKGAHFYVCGDATRMASDVHEALLAIVAEQGGRSADDAEEYVAAMKKDGRYQRDVY